MAAAAFTRQLRTEEARLNSRAAGERKTRTGWTMSLTVALLVVTLLGQCWSSPQRRNWTPQAILYLKGAQRHRSVLERTSREENDAVLPASHKWSSHGPEESKSTIFLELLQRAVEEGGENPDNYTDKWLDRAGYNLFLK